MKKIFLTAFGMMFIASSAFAVSIGVSGTALYYDASGTETVKGSNQLNEYSETGAAPIPSIFIETEADGGGTIGLEVIPYSAKVADFSNARTDTDGESQTSDVTDTAGTNKGDVNFKNHVTLYIERPLDGPMNGGFLRIGLNSVLIETDETLDTGSTYGDERVMGLTLGLGKRGETVNGGFFKIIGEVSRYQGATFDGSADSNSGKNSIELDDFTTAGIRFSVGKEF